MKRNHVFLFGGAFLFLALLFVLRFSSFGEAGLSFLSGRSGWFGVLVAVAALVDSVNPCAFSVLLITVAFLLSIGHTRGRILLFGGVYIAGIFLAYILIGLGILQAFAFFQIPNFIAKLTALLLIGIGAAELVHAFVPRFPVHFTIPESVRGRIALLMDRRSLPAMLLIGMLVGVSEFPCTGGPYLVILSLLHASRTFLQGFWYLVFYNLIFVAPLVAALIVASNASLVERIRSWRKERALQSRVSTGIILVVLGFAIFLFLY